MPRFPALSFVEQVLACKLRQKGLAIIEKPSDKELNYSVDHAICQELP